MRAIRPPHPLLLAALLVLAAPAAAVAADWPQYRGPDRDGRSSETGLRRSWPEGGPEVLWRISLGDGYSGIAVVGERVLTLYGEDGQEWAGAFDAGGGQRLWRFAMDRNRPDGQGSGPRSTPTVDGDLVFVLGARAKLYALGLASGEPRWSVDLVEEHGARIPQWGVSTSPLVDGDLLLVEVGGSGSHGLMAFHKTTGEVAWHAQSVEPGYSSPVIATIAGQRQAIFFPADGAMAVTPESGRLLWRFPWKTAYDVNAAMPVVVPSDEVFISSGYDVGAALLRIRPSGERFEVEEVWRNREMRNHYNSSVLVDGHLYGFDEGILKCVEAATGEATWRARGGYSKGSVLYADGHLIVLGGRGTLGLVRATPEGFQQAAQARILESRTWTMPSLSDGVLYVRDQSEMLALRVAGESDVSRAP